MGSENVCIKHEYSYNRDKQLQRKLLAADDTFSTESCAQSSNSVKGFYTAPDKKLCEVTGWCSGEKILLRKHESIAGGKPKASSSVTVVGRSDGRSRREQVDLSMPYVFRHYSDNRKYIEQYRQEHACSDTVNSPEIRNEYLCLQHRFYVYNKSKPRHNNSQEIKSAPLSIENSLTQNQIDQEGVKTDSNSACKLKTSTIITLQNINEIAQDKPDNAENELQNAIYNGNRLPVQQPFSRSAPVKQIGNKIIIPANHSMISPGFSKSLGMSRKTSQSPKGNSWERNSSALRTIDSLVCVTNTGDRQLEKNQEKRPSLKKPELESSSAGGQSAEASINSRPRFESVGYALPSNAMHLNASRLLTDSLLLNQAEYRCPALDAGSVFRPSAKSSLLTTPDKESMVKEIIHDLSPQRAEDISRQQKGVSGNLTEPELPSGSELQSALNQGQSCSSIHPQEAKILKTEGKQINDRGLAKHTRSMETSSGSSRTLRFRLATSNGSLEGNAVSTTAQTAITQTTTSIPYLTSWNGSQPRRLKGDNHWRSGSSGSEVNLRQLAEYILAADDLLPQGKFRDLQEHPENHTARKRPSIASGVYHAVGTDAPDRDLLGSLQALFLRQNQTGIMHHRKCTRGRTKSLGCITPSFAIRRNYLSFNCLQMRNAAVYGDYYKRFLPSPRGPDHLHLRSLIHQSNRHILGKYPVNNFLRESVKTLKGSKTARVSESPDSLDSRSQLSDIFNGVIGSSLESDERKGSHSSMF